MNSVNLSIMHQFQPPTFINIQPQHQIISLFPTTTSAYPGASPVRPAVLVAMANRKRKPGHDKSGEKVQTHSEETSQRLSSFLNLLAELEPQFYAIAITHNPGEPGNTKHLSTLLHYQSTFTRFQGQEQNDSCFDTSHAAVLSRANSSSATYQASSPVRSRTSTLFFSGYISTFTAKLKPSLRAKHFRS